MRHTYYKCETQKLESSIFSNTLVFNDLYCAFLTQISNWSWTARNMSLSYSPNECGYCPKVPILHIAVCLTYRGASNFDICDEVSTNKS